MTNNPQQPWLDHPQWKNGRIHSDAALAWKMLGGFALIWNLMAFGVSAAVLAEGLPRFPDPVYLVFLFPTAGLLLLWTAFKQFRQWRRFGQLSLTLDPYPGNIGAEVGGYVTLCARPADLTDLEATLSCVRITTSRSSKNSSRHETVVWRQRANTRVDLAANGARISFLATVDPGLPNAEPPSGNHCKWIIKLVSRQAGLDRGFDIPVFDTGRSEQSHLHIIPAPQTLTEMRLPSDIVQINRRTDGLELIYPSSRSSGAPIALFVIGLIFAAVGLFLVTQVIGTGSLFSSVVMGFMALIFTPIGLGLAAFGIYLKFNELRVLIGADTVVTRRSLGPWKRLRSATTAELSGLSKSIGMQSGQGANATIQYAIKAKAGDQKLTLGDGIQGQPLADGLLALIGDEIASYQRLSGIEAEQSPAAAEPLFDLGKVQNAQRMVKTVKRVTNMVALIVFALFLLEFFDFW